jgi:hypothetical protein
MLVFGGDDNGTPRHDLWSLSMTDAHPWKKLTPSGPTPPMPRAAAYDPVRDRMIILGGYWPAGEALNEVWAVLK